MLLVVSLDSENAEWLRLHMDSGELPNLAALSRSGVHVDVQTPALHGSVYPTLYHGLRPADHGHHFPLEWDPSGQCVVPWGCIPQEQTILERADLAGKRMVVLDPPESNVMHPRNGFCASGIQFRARVLLSSWSSNQTRYNGLLRTLGKSPRADEIFGELSVGDLRYLRSALLSAPERLAKAALDSLRRDAPDCLWLNCVGLHVGGHQFLHLPMIQDKHTRSVLEDTRLDLARGYDRMIGSLMDALPPKSRAMVAYAKGMGPVTQWTDLLPVMLRRILGQPEASQPATLLRRLLPRTLRRWMGNAMDDRQALDMMARLSTPRADWSRTRAFCLPTDYPGFIRFNLRGRERDGIVTAAAERELREEIVAGLRGFTDFDGEPAVECALTPLELVGSGEKLHRFPDLIVRWKQRPGQSSPGVRSERFGEIRRTAEVIGRSGNHCPGAFAILSGANATSGLMQAEDIPATILDGLGVPIADLPGKSFWT
ncbi:MAG: hypothetical protein HY820_13125 [Acidobacteria bacterium]|nr:hypothetical protein [Acidobacteriota bacterium]